MTNLKDDDLETFAAVGAALLGKSGSDLLQFFDEARQFLRLCTEFQSTGLQLKVILLKMKEVKPLPPRLEKLLTLIEELQAIAQRENTGDSSEQTPEPQEFIVYRKSIKTLNLDTRAANCLRAEDIYYLGDLVILSEEKLMGIPYFGRKSLNIVKDALACIGLSLGTLIPNWPPKDLQKSN